MWLATCRLRVVLRSLGSRQDRGLRRFRAVTLVTLPYMTDAATMRKISYWRYSAVNRKNLFAALACALLAFSMLGCNAFQTTNHLRSITLMPSGGGLFNLKGIGGTLQLVATGTYSSGQTKDLTNVVTYTVTPDPNGMALPTPPLTVTMSPTGLMTAVEPAVCTWHDTQTDATKPPTWVITGSYIVTASIQGITSQQAFVTVASAAGDAPDGSCGP